MHPVAADQKAGFNHDLSQITASFEVSYTKPNSGGLAYHRMSR